MAKVGKFTGTVTKYDKGTPVKTDVYKEGTKTNTYVGGRKGPGVPSSGPQPVGGFTTLEGESVLVTPYGEIVGSGDPTIQPKKATSPVGGTRGYGIGGGTATPTEQALSMSLPAGLRNKPVEVVRRQLNISRGGVNPQLLKTQREKERQKFIEGLRSKSKSKTKEEQIKQLIAEGKGKKVKDIPPGFILDNLQKTQKRLQTIKEKRESGKKLSVKEQATAALFYLGKPLYETAYSIKQLPKAPRTVANFVVAAKQDPSLIKKTGKEIGTQIKKDFLESVTLIRTGSPGEVVGFIGGQLFIFGATSKGLKIVGKVTDKGVNTLLNQNPKLLKVVKKGVDEIVELPGDKATLTIGKGLTKGTPGKKLTVGVVKTFEESLSTQAARGGTRALAVSAQANKLVGFIRRGKVIRKPIPGESELKQATKDLLKKFDKGTITKKEFLKLQRDVRKQTISPIQPRGVDLLERSLFFDPKGGLRKSRLALQDPKEGSFLDLIRGRATIQLRKQKPQILVLEDLIESLPKTKEFKGILEKFKKGQPLTDKELTQLSTWQVTPSGKLKPIGSTTFRQGVEREVTLAPGEAIKRYKKFGTLLVNGKRIPIVGVKIVKGKRNVNIIKKVNSIRDKIKDLILQKSKLTSKKTLTKVEQRKVASINKKLVSERSKLTKTKARAKTDALKDFLETKKSVSRRRVGPQKKVFRVRRRIGTAGLRALPGRKIVGRSTPGRPSSRPTPGRVPGRVPTRPTPGRPTTPTGSTPTGGRTPERPRVPSRPGRPPTTGRPPVRITGGKKTGKNRLLLSSRKTKVRKVKKGKEGFNIFGKDKGKFIKLNSEPLSERDALSRGAYAVDNTTSKTAKIVPVGKVKKLGSIKSKEKGYYGRTRGKYRRFKVVKRKGIKIPRKFIERTRFGIDSRGEKRQLSLSRLRTQENYLKRKTVKRSKPKVKMKVKRRVSRGIFG